MKSFIAIVLVALTMTAAACCLVEVAFWMGVANPNVLADHPWPCNTLTGWWFSFASIIFSALVGAWLTIGAACLTGRVLGNVISKI